MQEMQVQSLGQEDLLENGMATHSSILAWRIPWTEESGGLQSMGDKESGMAEHVFTGTHNLDSNFNLDILGFFWGGAKNVKINIHKVPRTMP